LDEVYLTTEDIAEQLQISVYTVRRYIRSGKLRAVKLEGSYRIRRTEFERFLKQREIGELPDDS
jgi:excisionase family DNA binding protein